MRNLFVSQWTLFFIQKLINFVFDLLVECVRYMIIFPFEISLLKLQSNSFEVKIDLRRRIFNIVYKVVEMINFSYFQMINYNFDGVAGGWFVAYVCNL